MLSANCRFRKSQVFTARRDDSFYKYPKADRNPSTSGLAGLDSSGIANKRHFEFDDHMVQKFEFFFVIFIVNEFTFTLNRGLN